MMRVRALLPTLLTTLFTTVLLAGAGIAPASAAGTPATISAPQPERAPSNDLGGLMSPYVVCGKPTQTPHVQWTINNVATGEQTTFSWVGSAPGMKFPRVAAGTYASTITATCKGRLTTQTVTVVVERKTAATTISHREYRRIVRGMSKRRAERIIGYAGRLSYVSGRGHTVVFDMDPYRAWATVKFRHGKVVRKHWNVPHA